MIDQGRGGDGTVQVMFEYYTRVFDLLIGATTDQKLEKSETTQFERDSGGTSQMACIIKGIHRASPLILNVIKESEKSRVFAKHSIAYWLHTCRRLRPGGIGQDRRPQTVGLTRAVFEAALQKSGTSALCTGIGESE